MSEIIKKKSSIKKRDPFSNENVDPNLTKKKRSRTINTKYSSNYETMDSSSTKKAKREKKNLEKIDKKTRGEQIIQKEIEKEIICRHNNNKKKTVISDSSATESEEYDSNEEIELNDCAESKNVDLFEQKAPIVTDPDLFGKDWPDDKMVQLIDQVWCKARDLDIALGASSQATHLVRRLITGVLKQSGYLNATYTGQPPRAHKLKNTDSLKPLNIAAKNAIINYALKIAEEKNWKNKNGVPTTRDQLQIAMTQRLGELKRLHELNNGEKKNPPDAT